MASIREHILKTLDLLQSMGDSALEAAEAGDGPRYADLMLDVRDTVREEQGWLRGVSADRTSRTRAVLTRYRLALAQVEVLGGSIIERFPDFDEGIRGQDRDALIRLLTLRIDVERLQE